MQRTTQALVVLTTLLALSALAPSCGGDDEISSADFAEKYAKAFCDYTYRCCEGSERSYGSKPQCEAQLTERLGPMIEATKPTEAEEKAGARFVGSAAASCLDQLAGECPAATSAAASCLDRAIEPTRGDGDACTRDAECTSHNCSASGGAGVCVATAVSGGSCGGDDRGCPEEHFCSSAKICTARKEAGDRCTRPSECVSGICNPSEKVCGGAPTGFCDGRE